MFKTVYAQYGRIKRTRIKDNILDVCSGRRALKVDRCKSFKCIKRAGTSISQKVDSGILFIRHDLVYDDEIIYTRIKIEISRFISLDNIF